MIFDTQDSIVGPGGAAATAVTGMGKRVARIDGAALGLRYPLAEADWPAVRAHARSAREKIRGGPREPARAGIAAHSGGLHLLGAMFRPQPGRTEERVPDQLTMVMGGMQALDLPHPLARLR